jgi:hypothetical protein
MPDRDPATYDPADAVAGTLDDGNGRRVMRSALQPLHDADRAAGERML